MKVAFVQGAAQDVGDATRKAALAVFVVLLGVVVAIAVAPVLAEQLLGALDLLAQASRALAGDRPVVHAPHVPPPSPA